MTQMVLTSVDMGMAPDDEESPLTAEGISSTYDLVADEYADAFSDELDGKPFDRELLDRLASTAANSGLVCDLGCGPAQVGAYLAARGCDVIGIDNSAGMLRAAQDRHPDLRFELGDMRKLPLGDASCAAVACFYSLIHLPRVDVPVGLTEIARILLPGGTLLLAVHGGEGELHADSWFGKEVSVDATLFSSAELVEALQAAGFRDCLVSTREPYRQEHQTPRLYLNATRA